MSFAINEKIVCVDASTDHQGENHLSLGTIYVVRGFDDCQKLNADRKPGVHLVGIWPDIPIGFKQTRFRKLSEIQEENRAKRNVSKEVPV